MELDKSTRAKLKIVITQKIRDLTESRIIVKTPYALSTNEKLTFEKKFGGGTKTGEIEYLVDKSILAGFVVAKGSTVIDGSLASRLDRLLANHI
ncbi:hypothetical protein A3D80_04485 [Candidatus Roizmanbacteria bacterium RIFCSPHIGHO2_02_FULL_40_13b]|uniref:Uncharacterized protein n=1 Tax=Candidatus Roizmanbacteria bacterium RIFCSPHIGHO2_01_FULL_39_24 TaxID=1802032 RepID=A0A1F7GFL9_9BACT|nr:MAG: hypothetical protein A2799_04495 [Candidatus Roizmanbacteria bacterium RIFCSPHIGHO2_01_FULL_39_24]OGK26422.1 MAG: hypothetical protein A3D80_04485 [Candidatus Roizmanbacteria bacterium RIFCSPHIGHO2_02_FULL_40_13b]OGK49034.1 MAG: hypothetical protein A3A56_03325 [Candidatus Roizmanbacteria bacterium RIFCSPLOWO2_01_FULL_40_32]OGK57044.1 MAG: hypothetical protein A3H83_00465 [Candidatus Roizmanbacteria bacterium RIFCSPLOWO2_02_FULL_39_8]